MLRKIYQSGSLKPRKLRGFLFPLKMYPCQILNNLLKIIRVKYFLLQIIDG